MFRGIDFVWPVKIAYVTTVMILLGLAVGDLVLALQNKEADLFQIGYYAYRLIVEAAASIGLIILGYFFFLHAFPMVDLSGLDLTVKGRDQYRGHKSSGFHNFRDR